MKYPRTMGSHRVQYPVQLRSNSNEGWFVERRCTLCLAWANIGQRSPRPRLKEVI